MNYEFGMDHKDPLNSGISATGMVKTYAADTGSMSNYMNNEKPNMDNTFEIPNNFTPARINEGFMDSQQFPLISGGDNNFSDIANPFIGKREFPFGKDTMGKSSKKTPNLDFKKMFISNKCSELSNANNLEPEANQTKFSKDQMMDVYLEDASGSKMSNSRFRIETEKED